jgi:2-(1,2-epoxy-1,2-dihydrophenyl)acetyl-CoA isomerase
VTESAIDRVELVSDVIDGVLVLTLNRPDKGNALDRDAMQMLADRVGEAATDDDVRAILIRSTGRHFCVGADLVSANSSKGRAAIGSLARSLEQGANRLIESVWRVPKPVVSAVQGRAMGIGLHLAVAADFVVAGSDALFAEPFCKRGFSADSGGTFLLPALIGIQRSKEMLLRGTEISAETALDWGMVGQVVPSETLEAVATDLARELASGPTFSLGVTKRLVNDGASSLAEALSDESTGVELTIRSDDFKEGIRAFLDGRRAPTFTGR